MNKILFVINTVYQLFITINLRLNNMPEGKVDLVVSDHTPSLKRYVTGLEQSGLFERVYFHNSREFNNYFWGVPNDSKALVFKNAHDSIKSVHSEPVIDYSKYDCIYTANLDAYMKFIHKVYPEINFYQIEDGAATCSTDWKTISKRWDYIDGFNKIYDDLKAIYLYSPDLMTVESPAPIIKLPTVQRTPENITIYNRIFNYSPIPFPKFVFIEQSFQVDNIVNNDLDFIGATFDFVGYENLYVKPHPRNTINRLFSYGLSKICDDSVPFELMLLNNPNNDSVYITVDSGALISTRAIFEDDLKTIFLYKAITGKTHFHGSDLFMKYMDSFCDKYASPNLMVPGSLEEYKSILHLLTKD